ncbi:MAG: hypothetical protein AMXMBFR7_16340 [Planctomycetota bacterium]
MTPEEMAKLPPEVMRLFEDAERDNLSEPTPDAGAREIMPAGRPAGSSRASVPPGEAMPDAERAARYAAKVNGAGEGGRNDALNALAYRLLELFNLTEEEHRGLCLDFAARCAPPIPEREALATTGSAWKGAHRKGRAGAARTEPKRKRSSATPPAKRARGVPQGEAAAFLDAALQEKLETVAAMKGTSRDKAALALLEEIAAALAGAPAVTQERVKKEACKALDLNARAFDRALREAKRKDDGADDDGEGAGRPNYQDLARELLRAEGYGEPGALCRLRHLKDDFFTWQGTHYRRETDSTFKARVCRFLQSFPGASHRVSHQMVSNVALNLVGLIFLPDETEPPCYLEESEMRSNPYLVAMRNGVLDLQALMEGQPDVLKPHGPTFFNLNALQYDYKPGATCPKFLKYLEEVQPDATVRELLQEWAGYLLVPLTKMHAFMLIDGEGSNGKSVYLAALRALLGEENYSSVPLQAFAAERPFALVDTLGKLANFDYDVTFIEMREEGRLKSWVSGEPVLVERKGRDAMSIRPTARLTFACNDRPFFRDKSKGIWRRMLYVRFNQTIGEEQKIAGMDEPGWWLEAGELEGMFLWAVEGLKRLLARGRFLEPEACKNDKAEYKDDLNPAATFLREHAEEQTGAETATRELYEAYELWFRENGHQPKYKLTKAHFGREVRRIFPAVELTKHARTKLVMVQPSLWEAAKGAQPREETVRDRVWIGLQFHAEGVPCPNEAHAEAEGAGHAAD